MTRKVKPLIQLEQLEPRILLSADGLLNSIVPEQDQDMSLDGMQDVIQYVELLETQEQVEEQINQELTSSDSTDTNICQPIFTLLVDDDNTYDELVDADLSVDNIGSAQVNSEITVLLNDSDGDIESKVDKTEDDGLQVFVNDLEISIEENTSIEIRGPPASETINSEITTSSSIKNEESEADHAILDEYAAELQPDGTANLPGLVLVDPDLTNLEGQVVYLDFDGEENVAYSGPVLVEGIDVPEFALPGSLAGQEEVVVTRVVEELKCIFTGSGVVFTTQKPDSGQAYSTVFIGGNDSAFADYGSFMGLAEQVDVGNQDPCDNAFVFSEAVVSNHTRTGTVTTDLANLIAHEVGHLLGYAHEHQVAQGGMLSAEAKDQVAAYWRFEEGSGTSTLDSSSNGNTGTITGATYTTDTTVLPGATNNFALLFDGPRDCVTIPAGPATNLYSFSNGITIEAFIKTTTLPIPTDNQGKRIMYILWADDDAYSLLLASNTEGNTYLVSYVNCGYGEWVSLSAPFSNDLAGVFSHVAMTFGSGVIRLYINGVEVAQGSDGGTCGSAVGPVWSRNVVRIGNDETTDSSFHDRAFRGVIDEVRITAHQLYPEQFLCLSPLTETTSAESTLSDTLLSQKVIVNDLVVSGDLKGTINFRDFELVSITTGPFGGKGFSKSEWQANLEGSQYKGSCRCMSFLKEKERRVYLKGTVSGELSGVLEGHLEESVPGSGVYDRYQCTWSIGRFGTRITSATVNLNGNLSYQSVSEFPATELCILQTSFEGTVSGSYKGPLSAILTHVEVVDETNPYAGRGFSIISYSSDFGSGLAWTHDSVTSPAVTELKGLLSKPLFGILFGILSQSELQRTLSLTLQRVDLGLPPMPDLEVKTWGPQRVSPGSTINYLVEVRNDGVKSAEDVDVRMKLPYEVDYVSATSGGTYNPASHEVVWYRANIPARSIEYVSVKERVEWGLVGHTRFENIVYVPKEKIEFPVDSDITLDYEVVETSETTIKGKIKMLESGEILDTIHIEITWEGPWEAGSCLDYIESTTQVKFNMKLILHDSLINTWLCVCPQGKTAVDLAKDWIEYTKAGKERKVLLDWLLAQNLINPTDHKDLCDNNWGVTAGMKAVTFYFKMSQLGTSTSTIFGMALEDYIDWYAKSSLDVYDIMLATFIYQHKIGPLPPGWSKDLQFIQKLRKLYNKYYKQFFEIVSSNESEVITADDPNIKYGPEGNVSPGEQLDYKVEYENEGEGIAFGVYFTDTLDEDLDDTTLVIGPVIDVDDGSIIAEPGIYNPATRTITWFVGEVGSGEGGYAEFSVNVMDDAPHGTEIINYATVYFPSVPEETRTNGIVSVVSLNQPPVAAAGGPYTVAEGGSVLLDASGTTDPDLPDDVLTYEWDFDGDGEYDDATGVHPTFSAALLDGPDSKTVGLKVTDSYGEFNTSEAPIDVINVAPSLADATFEVEENSPNGMVVGMISGTDPGDDLLTYSIVGGTGATAFAINANSGQITVADATQLDYETTLSLTLEVQVADDDNATDNATVTITLLNQASITGFVFVDVNENGVYEAKEPGIDGVTIELLDENGVPILDTQNNPVTAITGDGGFYLFEDLDPGTYQLCEVQPTGVDDGVEILGSLGGTIPANDTMRLTLERIDATDYNFAELGKSVASGDTATIGFWQNKHGQALIRQGGIALANWLSNNFGNVFGDMFVGGDGNDVASFYRDQLFRQKSQKSAGPAKADAQFMAVALATYFTSSNLAGNVASAYGFNVTDTGIGTKLVNIGDNGTAFSISNGTDLTIMQLLLATDNLTNQPESLSGSARIYDLNGDGEIDEYEAVLRTQANDVFSTINELGDIF